MSMVIPAIAPRRMAAVTEPEPVVAMCMFSDACLDQSLALRLRQPEVKQLFVRFVAVLMRERTDALEAIANLVEKQINALSSHPFTRRQVQRILGITNQKRLVWIQDGHLQQTGTILNNQRGQKFRVPVYYAERNGWLNQNPDMIEAWRDEDARILTYEDRSNAALSS
ncbi:hypothetical protein D3W54_10550 [Komagataeibacter medellinensis]|uniref:Uncharacterized protein n=2 Tax=Komagataeibacter medellinensis TaxID=1177712 RepID=A0ABQ6VY34_9PROT|nr:hypothetical protein D3W54_10550 [Komagataeibacter medellinensis]